MSPDPRRSEDQPVRPNYVIVICMATALFFFLLWLGMTLIEDNARNSALISSALTLLFVISLYVRPSGKRRQG